MRLRGGSESSVYSASLRGGSEMSVYSAVPVQALGEGQSSFFFPAENKKEVGGGSPTSRMSI